MSTSKTIEERLHRHSLKQERDIRKRALQKLLELSVLGGGNVLGDLIDRNDDLQLDEIRSRIPSSLNQHNRDLLFWAIEILNQ